jgi:hypothetical protein
MFFSNPEIIRRKAIKLGLVRKGSPLIDVDAALGRRRRSADIQSVYWPAAGRWSVRNQSLPVVLYLPLEMVCRYHEV